MNNKRRVLLFDDETATRLAWKRRLESLEGFSDEFTIESTDAGELSAILQGLRLRQARARTSDDEDNGNLLDTVDLLIVDFDLFAGDNRHEATGEEVAYLARCYSTCGFIIGVNQFGENVFDLTLRGHPDSFADLNIGSAQLANPGLWSYAWNSFRPWHWPLLTEAVDSFHRRASDILGSLDEKIVDFLGVPLDIKEIVPRSALEFIGTDQAANETSFREFVSDSGKGVRTKDRVNEPAYIARIAAARVGKWLERLVLPGQNILIDAPHLLERFPSLGRLSQTSSAADWPAGSDLLFPSPQVLDLEKIKRHSFERKDWLSRAAWFWPALGDLPDIDEVSDPWSRVSVDLAFCEDLSRFRPLAEVKGFVAEVESPFIQRYVLGPGHSETTDVSYRPSVRFAL